MTQTDSGGRRRVPVQDLVDLEALSPAGRPPHPARLRAALPRGWRLEEDPRYARRDLGLFLREGWILILGLLIFGAVGLYSFWSVFPGGLPGVARFAALVVLVLLAGGIVGPLVTRALMQGDDTRGK
ncbi:MAG: hypothetical protein ABGY71_00205 [bacterium]|jgi:hypothetical protein|nr:hypothetical protein [Planctomycetota bacterium]HIL52255.1 hypothetical protein [Planctomycetota bacterium]